MLNGCELDYQKSGRNNTTLHLKEPKTIGYTACYIDNLFHSFYYKLGEECLLLYQGARCRDCYGCLILRVCDTKNKTTSAIWEQQSKANNEIDWERVKILDQETVDIITKSKEPIQIRRQHPILNRAGGYELPAIFNHLLSRD